MQIPFMNLKRQNDALIEEYLAAVRRVIEGGVFILGPEVEEFERSFAAWQGVRFCLGTSSGTTALHLALAACGIGPGDEVITPCNSFVATAEAIAQCGARPVFVDVDKETLLIDPTLIEAAVTPRTRAIVPVHLYGCPTAMKPIMEIAQKYDLYLIEDAAQAHGASIEGKGAGGFGHAGIFSFFPGKNLGALGDGGAVVTNDEKLYAKMRSMRNHGAQRKYIHETVGFNYRMDAVKGATLSIKLRHMDRWTEKRLARVELYLELLAGASIRLPVVPPGVKHVFHLFVVRTRARDRLAGFLKERGIATNIHYPVPIHQQKAFAHLGYSRGDFPVAEEASGEILSLPLCADITEDEVREVCRAVKDGLGRY
ncbi:MAG: DegT/DnrJ/EryC1/StrS family aminotransferase [Gemmatimonadota bacterium]|nr:DegT/DnrJ/EryC1/StrS family aminotransferase [Gemmatimonadota bacterium]